MRILSLHIGVSQVEVEFSRHACSGVWGENPGSGLQGSQFGSVVRSATQLMSRLSLPA